MKHFLNYGLYVWVMLYFLHSYPERLAYGMSWLGECASFLSDVPHVWVRKMEFILLPSADPGDNSFPNSLFSQVLMLEIILFQYLIVKKFKHTEELKEFYYEHSSIHHRHPTVKSLICLIYHIFIYPFKCYLFYNKYYRLNNKCYLLIHFKNIADISTLPLQKNTSAYISLTVFDAYVQFLFLKYSIIYKKMHKS